MTTTHSSGRMLAAILVGALSISAATCGQKKLPADDDGGSGGAPATGGGPAVGGRGGSAPGGGASGTAGNEQGAGGGGGMANRVPARHRAERGTCGPNPTPTAATCNPVGTQGTADSTCTLDAQCTAGANGRCIQYSIIESEVRCRCTYTQCHTDQECSSGGPCHCGGTDPNAWGNACLEGNCQVDTDCGPGGFCSPTRRRSTRIEEADRPTAISGYYCHTPQDACVNDEDCIPFANVIANCAYDEGQHRWTCVDYLTQ